MTYNELSNRLNALGIDQHASELHGVLTGFVAAGGSPDHADTLVEWMDIDGSEQASGLLAALLRETGGQLADPELGFEPILPDDEQPLSARGRGVGLWCTGFISGFGIGGGAGDGESAGGPPIDDEVREVLSDLGKIATMTDEIPDSEENETDLTEIIEYVRVTALLVFASCALGDEQGDQ